VQPLGFGRGDVLLRTGNAVTREKGMGVEVDLERHSPERNLAGAKCKASVFGDRAELSDKRSSFHEASRGMAFETRRRIEPGPQTTRRTLP